MKLLVEINHYPGILDREFDITYIGLGKRGEKRGFITVSSRFGEIPLRTGLDHLAIKDLAKKYLDFDVVICTNLPTILAGKLARKMGFSGKIIFDDYGVWPWKGFLPWGPLAVFFPCWVRANIISCKEAIDVAVTPSEFERQNAIRKYGFKPESVLKIPYTIEDFFSPSVSGNEFRSKIGVEDTELLITYAGRLNPTKGIDRLVRALLLIRNEIPSRLLLVGRNQRFLRKILRISRSLSVLDKVIYAGFLPRERMPEVYAASDIVVIPSLYETFCFAALEAMACGRPVIASNVGSLPEVVGDAGILCDPNPKELASAIKRLWNDKELARELMEKGPQRAKEIRTKAERILRVLSS